MALHTKTQFGALCGLSGSNITTYVQRGKLIPTGDFIDDTIPYNADFIKLRALKNAQPPLPVKSENTPPPSPSVPDQVRELVLKGQAKVKQAKQKKEKPPQVDHQRYDIEIQQKALQLEKTQEEIEILKIKKEKLHGAVIPTELAHNMMITHSESLKVAYNEASENLIVVMGQKKQLSTHDIADIRSELTKIVNSAIDKAITLSSRTLKLIVLEYSQAKAVGEKE
jgi:hypothetical protein